VLNRSGHHKIGPIDRTFKRRPAARTIAVGFVVRDLSEVDVADRGRS
jgi:hypothetical protein